MPVAGDFLSFRLPREFIDPWDDWVQAALGQSHQRFGEDWLEIYLTSPVWCFSLAPSICGGRAWAGVLMPSVDAVGRYFPLTIAAPLREGTNVFTLPTIARAWFTEIEAAALSCLSDSFVLNEFDEAIERLNPPDGNPAPVVDEGLAKQDVLTNAWRYGMPGSDQITHDCPALLHDCLERLLYTYSVWWTNGSTRVTPSYLLCQGLPPPTGYAAMLDGNWNECGWDDRRVLDISEGVGIGDTPHE